MQLYADMLFTNGRVYTADARAPWAEAVAVRGERLLAVGTVADLAELRGPRTEVIDLAGRLLLPGFTESHVHFIELALRATEIDVTAAPSAHAVAEMVRARVAAQADRPSAWLRGAGWHASTWTDGVRPHRGLLDAVAPDVPVALDSKDLHSIWLNSAALRRAGITTATADVPGGVIERDTDGEPTGVLRENAVGLAYNAIPKPELAETVTAVKAAIPGMWATGIVALHNANDSADGLALRTYQALRKQGELGLRVVQHLPATISIMRARSGCKAG